MPSVNNAARVTGVGHVRSDGYKDLGQAEDDLLTPLAGKFRRLEPIAHHWT
jgi:hypothetical protein